MDELPGRMISAAPSAIGGPFQLLDLPLDGLRLLTMNDQYYFVSPELKAKLEVSPFQYLRFTEGLRGFAGSAA